MQQDLNPQDIIDEIKQYEKRLIDFRRRVHREPEVGFDTALTLKKIAEFLKENGIEGLDTAATPGSGFLLIQGSKPGKTIALRADIDALSITEQSGCPWASENGMAHSCGHDGHQTWLLAAILYLSRHRGFAGNILCIFQAAEESVNGADSVVQSGVFKKYDVKEIYGAHNEPLLDLGMIGFRAGPTMAACDRFEIDVKGVGTHGARPNLGKDPLPAAAEIFIALQTLVSRTLDPFKSAVVSVCSFTAGNPNTYNIIPETVHLLGTTRTFEEPVRDLIEHEIKTRSVGIAKAFGLEAEARYIRLVGAVDNDTELTDFAERAAARMFGSERTLRLTEPYMISEDFSAYQKVVPGCFFFIGVRDKEHQAALHSPHYDFNDRIITEAGALFAYLALSSLADRQ